jgi:hypothetical protein
MKKLLLLLTLALVTQLTFAQNVPSYVPTDGLVGYWPFNGNANDESGNGNNGVKNQVGESADRFGNLKSSYYFDGVSSYIGVAKTSSVELFGNDFSISVWVNSQSIDNWGSNLISKSFNNLTIGNKDNGSSGLPNTNVKYGVGFDTYGKNYGIYPDILPKTGWNHIVCVKTSNGYDYYINNQKYSLPYNYNNVSKSDINSALFFGKRNGGGGGANFNGYLDDIGIYNRALTQEEITNLYNANQCITNITVTDTLIINVGQLSFNDPVAWANNITIAPNPANSQININFNNITNLNGGTLKVINSSGQQVSSTPINLSGTNTTLALTTWGGAGLYFVQIINPQGQIVDIKKIILQ